MTHEKKKGISYEAQLNARINMTDFITGVFLEISPLTRNWEDIDEKEQQSKNETH